MALVEIAAGGARLLRAARIADRLSADIEAVDQALGVSPGETLWATFPSRVLAERAPATVPDAPAQL